MLQQEMALMGVLDSEPRLLDWNLVRHCRTEQQAMRLCKDKSYTRMTDDDLAEVLGMTRGALNTILNSDRNKRPRYMPRTKQICMQRVCGNRAIDQWAELYEKGQLQYQIDAEREKVYVDVEHRQSFRQAR